MRDELFLMKGVVSGISSVLGSGSGSPKFAGLGSWGCVTTVVTQSENLYVFPRGLWN